MKTKYYFLTFIFLLSFGSCKKYLETKPTDFLNPDAYYETEAQLDFARSSVYHIVGASQLWGSWANYLLGWQGDEGYMNRFTLTTGPWNYFYSSADSYNAGYWSNLYNGINRANVVLANLDKNTAISQAKRDVIRGEVLFLRGYFYFQLVQYYGGVPLKITPTSSVVDVDIPRASIKDTYTQILKDMEAAEPLVPGIASLGYGGAISKSAVRGMLARVNLYMAGEPLKEQARYSEASKWAKMVIDDAESAHALNASYPQIFINLCSDKYDIKESIWEAEFWGNRLDQYTETSNIGYINGPASTAATINGLADSYMSITSKLYDVFEPGDNRKWWDITHFTYTATGKTMVALPATQAAKNVLRPAKWRREYEVVAKNGANTPNNIAILRYTDVLLMYAEAQNEINNGPTPEVINYVNLIRKRAWSTGVKTITVTNGGSGYTTAPTVTFSAGSGATAAGVATISGGVVTAITLSRDITGVTFNQDGKYTTAPTISISGGGGTGATASATIYLPADAELKPAQTASKSAFLAAIQDERFREFNYEGLRKADLLRWGIFLQVNQDMGNLLNNEIPGNAAVKYFTNVSAKDLFMPIPTSETTTNLAITQNPGWN
ncbi:hypothetical protein HDC92_003636 [Pedobacter sp. AK017]|uniref:RagB/SusD family nutrient uptake outer membrane protein n=1 Tax=Pedobacter sp. AK017 TaxID=2723073 RepID=UPI001619B214|nr:RagB/SusD family nutrient uptake outer membrane protein [Pedobacter sp. AK017]MBB5439940.1 hypothetical protein [Pedobacter sp. AK017]